MNELKMLNREEVAHLLGTTVYTVDKLRDTAVLLPIKIGKHYMYSQFEIKRFQTEYAGYSLGNEEEMIQSLKHKNEQTLERNLENV